MKDLISIILPTYNSEKTLKSTINTVLNQTYSYFELMVIDDGSSDGTADLIEEIKDSRLKYFFQKNQGQGAARNYGIEKSEGEFIVFIDSDDSYDSYFLENMLENIKKQNSDIVECNYLISEKGSIRQINIYNKIKVINNNSNSLKMYLKNGIKIPNSTYPVWNKIYRSTIIKEKNIKFKVESYNEDYLFNFEYLQYVNSFVGIKYAGYIYIRDEMSTTKSILKKNDYYLVNNSKIAFDIAEKSHMDDCILKMTEIRYLHSFYSLYAKAFRFGVDKEMSEEIKEIKNEMNKGLKKLMLSGLPFKRKLTILGTFLSKNILEVKVK